MNWVLVSMSLREIKATDKGRERETNTEVLMRKLDTVADLN